MLKKYLNILTVLLICICFLAGCNSNNRHDEIIEEDTKTEGTHENKEDTKNERPQGSSDSNSQTIKTKEQILSDLSKRNTSIDRVYDEIVINKRQTQKEKLLDTIYATIKCHTDKIAYVESYKITYGLYNEGWMLDTVELDWNYENSSRAISHPGPEAIKGLMDAYNSDENITLRIHDSHYNRKYDNYKIIDMTFDESNQTATTTIKAIVEGEFATIIDTIVIEEWFDDGWCVLNSIKDSITNSTLDYTRAVGKHMMYYFDEPTGLTFEIESLDTKKQTISIKCQYYDFTSNGLELVNWDGTYKLTIDPYFKSWETGDYCNHYLTFECNIDDWWSMRIDINGIDIYWGSNYKYTISPEHIST